MSGAHSIFQTRMAVSDSEGSRVMWMSLTIDMDVSCNPDNALPICVPLIYEGKNAWAQGRFRRIEIVNWNLAPAAPVGSLTEDERRVSPARYQKCAEECKRLAKATSHADGKVMLEIAEAWLVCANQRRR